MWRMFTEAKAMGVVLEEVDEVSDLCHGSFKNIWKSTYMTWSGFLTRETAA